MVPVEGRAGFTLPILQTIYYSATELKIEDLSLGSHVNEMGSSIQLHVREEVRFIQLAVFGTRQADSGLDFIFNQVRQIALGAVTCGCFNG